MYKFKLPLATAKWFIWAFRRRIRCVSFVKESFIKSILPFKSRVSFHFTNEPTIRLQCVKVVNVTIDEYINFVEDNPEFTGFQYEIQTEFEENDTVTFEIFEN
jgi:hypothetical protein